MRFNREVQRTYRMEFRDGWFDYGLLGFDRAGNGEMGCAFSHGFRFSDLRSSF